MAGIDESEVIDLVAENPDGSALLVMVETREWGADPRQPDQLKAKLNTYAQFALDGSLTQHYPHLANKPVTIRLECREDPPAEISSIADAAQRRLSEYGVSLTVKVNPHL